MRLAALVLTLVLAPMVAGLRADDTKKDDKKDDMDKKTLAILKEAAGLYKNCKSFHADVAIAAVVAGEADKRSMKSEATIDHAKPNLLAVRGQGDKGLGLEVVSDGTKMFVSVRRQKEYSEAEAPADVAALGQSLPRLGLPNMGLLMQNILADDPYETLMDGVTAASYAGKEDVNGTSAHHLKFVQPNLDWELWVAAEGKPVIMKVASALGSDDQKIVVTETYKGWKFDEAPAKSTFAFTAPKDSKKVDDIDLRRPSDN
jgi:hypothetical protein